MGSRVESQAQILEMPGGKVKVCLLVLMACRGNGRQEARYMRRPSVGVLPFMTKGMLAGAHSRSSWHFDLDHVRSRLAALTIGSRGM